MPTPPDRVKRWARAQSPFQEPPFTLPHWVLAGVILLFLAGVVFATGLLSDVFSVQVGATFHPVISSWEVGQLVRIAVTVLYLWAVFGVRAMHRLTLVSCLGVLLFLGWQISEVRITHDPLILGYLLLYLGLAFSVVRIGTRPNEHELALKYQQERSQDA